MTMQKRFGFLMLILVVILAGSRVSYAQEVTAVPDVGWPVVERCVGEPIKLSERVEYEGTLFTSDSGKYRYDGGGFYAFRNKISTLYYVYVAENGKDIVYAGALSPDGKWFAVPYGYSVDQHIDAFGNSTGSEYRVKQIRIYRTDYTYLSYWVDWQLSGQNVDIFKVMWLDNDRLIYWQDTDSSNEKVTIVVNPFANEQSAWAKVRDTLTVSEWRVFLASNNPRENGWLVEPKLSKRTQELVDQYRFNKSDIRWLPDLSGFVVFIPFSANSRQGLTVFNEQDGLKSIITSNVVSQVKISADGRYVAFQTGETGYQSQEAPEINIADLQTQTISQLCYGADYPMFEWAPFTDQLAIRKDGVVSILNLDSWNSYFIVAKQGRLVGWRKGW